MSYDPQDRALEDGRSGAAGPPLKLIGFGIVALLCLFFVIQNTDRATVTFLFWDAESRVWVTIVIAILLGVLLDRLFLAWWRRRGRRD